MTARPRNVIYELPLKQFGADCPWAVHSIGQLADVLGGGTPDTGVIEFWEPAEIPWATPTDITATDGNEIRVTDRSISSAGLKQSTLVPENSVLMTSRATIGAAKINRVPMAINQGFAAFCAKEGHSAEYLFHLLEILRPTLIRLGAGTTFLETSRREIRKVQLRVPDEDEQRRIAAALRLADDAIQKARAELDATRELKRSLMKSAFSEGLERYRTGWQETKLGRLPSSWQVRRVKDVLVGKPSTGYSPQSNPEPPGTKTLNVSCIRNGECAIEKATYVDIDKAIVESLQVCRGDFFVLRGNGNRDFIGIGGVVRDDIAEPMIYSDLLFRLQFRDTEAVPLFLPYMWQTQAFLHRLQAKAKSGSGLWKIGKRDIENELLALPDKGEQQEIVNLIETNTDACNAAARKVEALTEVKRSLLQNLLTGKIRIPEGAIHA